MRRRMVRGTDGWMSIAAAGYEGSAFLAGSIELAGLNIPNSRSRTNPRSRGSSRRDQQRSRKLARC
jgi:hypothetical protein